MSIVDLKLMIVRLITIIVDDKQRSYIWFVEKKARFKGKGMKMQILQFLVIQLQLHFCRQ